MTGRHRAVDTIFGQTPDRVPCVPLIDLSYASAVANVPVSTCFLDPKIHAQALVDALKRHPTIDGLSVNICLSDNVIIEFNKSQDGYLAKTTGGITWKVPRQDVGSVQACEIKSFERIIRTAVHNGRFPVDVQYGIFIDIDFLLFCQCYNTGNNAEEHQEDDH